jgi:hypothetical protein
LLVGVGDPFRFAPESKFARWCGTGAVALSSGEGHGLPVKHRLDFGGNRRINSVLYIASVTQHRDRDDARTYIDRKLGEGKTRREARRAHKRHLANRVIRRMWNDEPRRLTDRPPRRLASNAIYALTKPCYQAKTISSRLSSIDCSPSGANSVAVAVHRAVTVGGFDRSPGAGT